MEENKNYLVQRITDEGERWNSLFTAAALIHYIDMQDLISDIDYHIYDITELGAPKEIWYRGWQHGCLIEFVDKDGNVVLSGYGVDH